MTSHRLFQDPESPNYLYMREVIEEHELRSQKFVKPLTIAEEKDLALSLSEVKRLPEGVSKEELSNLTQMAHEIAQLEASLKLLRWARRTEVWNLFKRGVSINWLAERAGLTRTGVSSIVRPAKSEHVLINNKDVI